MIAGAIIGVIVLVIFCIVLLILNHKINEFADKVVNDYATLTLDYTEALIENSNLKTELAESKDMIKKLSEEINLKTVKPEASETAAEPITSKKTATKKTATKKTTTKKTNTKKKEVKE